jgi:hypothetical protein
VGANFLDCYRELQGTLPDLPEEQAKRFINRAQRDAYDAWNWSFLAGAGELHIPASLGDGTITLTQGSREVIADATAAAAWNALGMFIPITQRALKLGTDQPYQILAYDGVSTAYLDRVWPNATVSGETYSLYRPYYAAPSDFQRWVSVVDTTDAWNLIPGKKKEWLDWIDPQRSTIGGPAQFVSFFKLQRAETVPAFGANTDPTAILSQQLFELWPGPTAAMSLTTYYKKRGADLVEDTDESPFDDGVLISRGLYHAYRFAQANQVSFSKTAGKANWLEMKRDANADYLFELGNEIKRDDNINVASIINPTGNWAPSSSWLTRHLTWSEMSRAYAGNYSF